MLNTEAGASAQFFTLSTRAGDQRGDTVYGRGTRAARSYRHAVIRHPARAREGRDAISSTSRPLRPGDFTTAWLLAPGWKYDWELLGCHELDKSVDADQCAHVPLHVEPGRPIGLRMQQIPRGQRRRGQEVRRNRRLQGLGAGGARQTLSVQRGHASQSQHRPRQQSSPWETSTQAVQVLALDMDAWMESHHNEQRAGANALHVIGQA